MKDFFEEKVAPCWLRKKGSFRLAKMKPTAYVTETLNLNNQSDRRKSITSYLLT